MRGGSSIGAHLVDPTVSDMKTPERGDLMLPGRGMPRALRVLDNESRPRSVQNVALQNFPCYLTRFVGRRAEMNAVQRMLIDERLVTLSGAGGIGKTRLAVEVVSQLTDEFRDGAWYVDMAPITDPEVLALRVTRALQLPDQPDGDLVNALTRAIGDRRMLVVLDNCEHLLDVSAALIMRLLKECSGLTLLATSREPIGVAGEVTWRVPLMSPMGDATELFADRAARVCPGFRVTEDTAETVAEICRRLDGIPLAVELAAPLIRALSLTEIRDSLHDRFRLLTSGARNAVPRHHTLQASVDWSYGLLTLPERVLFRRLAAFVGGFDLDAAHAVGAFSKSERDELFELLTSLIDKSLILVGTGVESRRYRMLEIVRHYALEKLEQSGEAIAVRGRHRDYYVSVAASLHFPVDVGNEHRRLAQAESDIGNLRGVLTWVREQGDYELGLRLASSLHPLWFGRGRIQEGLGWFEVAFEGDDTAHQQITPAVRAQAMALRSALKASVGVEDRMDLAEDTVTVARGVGDPALLVTALIARGSMARTDPESARPYLSEAFVLADQNGDNATMSQIRGLQAFAAVMAGEPSTALKAAQEGERLANAIGQQLHSRICRSWLSWALLLQGDLSHAATAFAHLIKEADDNGNLLFTVHSSIAYSLTLSYLGKTIAARNAADAAIDTAARAGGTFEGLGYVAVAIAALAEGDVPAARQASETALTHRGSIWMALDVELMAHVSLAGGDLTAARSWADEAVSMANGAHASRALTTRARTAISAGEFEHAKSDAHQAIDIAATVRSYLGVPDALECLAAGLTADRTGQRAARILGAAHAMRRRIGVVRFRIYQTGYDASVAARRDALGNKVFEGAWAEGAAMSTAEVIAYVQRGADRNRRSSGWESLTNAEHEVVRLISEGLANKDIAARLFVSPRTVQTHLTHVYAKLGLTSRVQLANQAARRG